jgi:hypothetical protein
MENNDSPKLTNIQINDDFKSNSKQLTLTLGKGKLRKTSAVRKKNSILSKYNSVLDNAKEHKSNQILELKQITNKYSLSKFKPFKSSKTSDLTGPYSNGKLNRHDVTKSLEYNDLNELYVADKSKI